MFDRDKWNEIWATIVRNKTRSVLTAFGVSWGVLMFIVLVGFGNGFERGMQKELEGISTNCTFLVCGNTSEPYMGHRKGRHWAFDSHDIAIIREKVAGVGYVSPMLEDYRTDIVRGGAKGSFNTFGIYPDYFRIIEPEQMLYGRLLNEADIRERRKVCVIGKQVYETFFANGEDPVGGKIRMGGIYYDVVGVLHAVRSITGRPDYSIYLPYTTQQRLGQYGDSFWYMLISSAPGLRISDMEEEIKGLIKANHDISPTDEKALRSHNLEQMLDMVFNVLSGVKLLIWVIGLGALLSGVIGISNIMLVTVRERMREIGIRRALGARPFAIAAQIMSESLVLTALAGMIGFVAGTLLLTALGNVMSGEASGNGFAIVPYISFNLALGAVGILIVTGLLAGLMPTWKALKIKAIDAIRDE